MESGVEPTVASQVFKNRLRAPGHHKGVQHDRTSWRVCLDLPEGCFGVTRPVGSAERAWQQALEVQRRFPSAQVLVQRTTVRTVLIVPRSAPAIAPAGECGWCGQQLQQGECPRGCVL